MSIEKNRSELRRILSQDIFEKMYSNFMIQAEKNAVSKKANGSKVPVGIAYNNNEYTVDSGRFLQHFGQGTASRTPYISWYVVSIYYIVSDARIVLGIEEDRYAHIKRMSPIRYEHIGQKKVDVAVFYECASTNVNIAELYERFLSISEEVMMLGLK